MPGSASCVAAPGGGLVERLRICARGPRVVPAGLHQTSSASRSSSTRRRSTSSSRCSPRSVRTEFIGRGKYKVLPRQRRRRRAAHRRDSQHHDSRRPGSPTSSRPRRYILTVVAKIEFRDLKTNNVLWENPPLGVPRGVRGHGRHRRARPERVLRRRSSERARARGHRVRAVGRERDPGGVLSARVPATQPQIYEGAMRLAEGTKHDSCKRFARPADACRRPHAARRCRRPVDLLGDDEHEKSALALALGELVEEDLRAFNVERFYAVDTARDARSSVAEAARTLPMMAQRRVVDRPAGREAVRPEEEAEGGRGRSPTTTRRCRDRSSRSSTTWRDPSPTTTLAFVLLEPRRRQGHGRLPLAKNLKITKALLKAATIVVCTGLDGGKDPGLGSSSRRQAAGLAVDRAVVARLLQLSGRRLRAASRRRREAAAVCAREPDAHARARRGRRGRARASCATIGRWCGRSSAAMRRRPCASSRPRSTPATSPFRILGQLGYAVRTPPPRGRFPARRVPTAVDALLRTDLALKSSGGDPRVLLERLVWSCVGRRVRRGSGVVTPPSPCPPRA